MQLPAFQIRNNQVISTIAIGNCEAKRQRTMKNLSILLLTTTISIAFWACGKKIIPSEYDGIKFPYDQTFYSNNRPYAKSHYAEAPTDTFADLAALITTLQSDSVMKANGVSDSHNRTDEEIRNVYIRSCYLFMIERQIDNDYHLTVGDVDSLGKAKNCLNAEISGLPKDGDSISYATILSTRKWMFDRYPKLFKGPAATWFLNTKRFEKPLHIHLSGSLFWDSRHDAKWRSKPNLPVVSQWEVHPIREIIEW
jgi:hypothetical protein